MLDTRLRFYVPLGIAFSLLIAAGCASAPETRPERVELEASADAAVESMTRQDATLRELLDEVPGYVVFPAVGEGGFIVGGGTAAGVVYENGQPTGYAELREASVGAQAGGQSYTQLIVFRTDEALRRLKTGNFDMSADASATLITSGAAASAPFEDGTAVFVDDEAGAMVKAAIAAESIRFVPR